MSKVNIGGLLFDNVNMTEAISVILDRIGNGITGETSVVIFANQDILNHLGSDEDLTPEKINGSFLILPDGYSIVTAAGFLRTPLKERVCGPDLMPELIKKAAEQGYKNYFFGAGAGIAKRLADYFLTLHPEMKISGVCSPPFGEYSEEENGRMIAEINASRPDILWVSLGCPKQEKWLLKNRTKIKVPVTLAIGAAFDFYSGNKKRAPQFIRKIRLEWMFRLFQEPGRLWKRYIIGGFHFAFRILKQKFFNK